MRGRVGAPCDPILYNIDRDADLVVQAEAFTGEPYARFDHPRVFVKCKLTIGGAAHSSYKLYKQPY